MRQSNSFILVWVVSAALAFSLACASIAQEAVAQAPPAEPAAITSDKTEDPVTTADPKISADDLEVLLQPLTRDELLIEVGGWRDLLKAKLQETAKHGLSALSSKANEIGAPISEEDSEARLKKLEFLNQLRNEKSELTERLGIAIDAYEEKGGDPEEFRQYVIATLGLKVDITDGAMFWAAILGWMNSENGGRLVLRKLALFSGILAAFWVLSAFIGRVVRNAVDRHPGVSDLLKKFINRMVRRTVLFIGLLVAISSLGVNVSALFALVGGGAFVIGFALQDTLGSFAAGIMVLIYRPFDVGDIVNVGGVEGKVDNVSLVSTTIRTADNKSILVPNQSVWGQVITNSSANQDRRVDLIFGIGYDDDIEKAQEILAQLVKQHELTLETPEPVIKVHELAASSVNFVCRPWVRTEDYWDVYWDLTRQVKEAFDANGISIPFPQQDVHYSGAQ